MPLKLLLVLITAVLITAHAGTAQTNSADEKTILDIDEQWGLAFRTHDVKRLQDFLADDYVSIDVLGRASDKPNTLAHLKGLPEASARQDPNTKRDQQDIKVRLYVGDVAVITGLGTVTGSLGPLSSRFTRVWVRSNGTWKLTMFQVTRVGEGPLPGQSKQAPEKK